MLGAGEVRDRAKGQATTSLEVLSHQEFFCNLVQYNLGFGLRILLQYNLKKPLKVVFCAIHSAGLRDSCPTPLMRS